MKLARLYIPKYPNQPVFELEKRLAAAFNGYTLYPFGLGSWRDGTGNLVNEGVYVYDVVVDCCAALEQLLLQYKEEAKQEAVLYCINNEPIFL